MSIASDHLACFPPKQIDTKLTLLSTNANEMVETVVDETDVHVTEDIVAETVIHTEDIAEAGIDVTAGVAEAVIDVEMADEVAVRVAEIMVNSNEAVVDEADVANAVVDEDVVVAETKFPEAVVSRSESEFNRDKHFFFYT